MNNWDRDHIEALGRAVSRLIADHWAKLDEMNVFPGVTPQEVERALQAPIPERGSDAHEVLREFQEKILPYCMTIPSPNYYGLLNPTPTLISIFADALASALNQNVGAWGHSPSATTVEKQVVRWLCDVIGYDENALGTFTSGGTMANVTGLKLALHACLPHVAEQGLTSVGRPVTIYVSEEGHFSIDRAADVLGLGRANVRKIPADDRFKIDVRRLVEQIERDQREGRIPCAVIGVAGTTSTGAIDPLNELADIAERFGLWFHVDAAYGGAAVLSESVRPRLVGISRADSITVDPHKWFFVPFAAGLILVKEGKRLRQTFDIHPAYIPQRSSLTGEETLNFFQHGVLGSRRFVGLKLWMSLKHLGTEWYANVIDRQIELCRYLARRVEDHPDFEACAPVELGIFCFRYFPQTLRRQYAEADAARRHQIDQLLNETNLRLQILVEQSGKAWFSTTLLKGVRALRINILSYLTRREHIDRLFALIEEKAPLALSQVER